MILCLSLPYEGDYSIILSSVGLNINLDEIAYHDLQVVYRYM